MPNPVHTCMWMNVSNKRKPIAKSFTLVWHFPQWTARSISVRHRSFPFATQSMSGSRLSEPRWTAPGCWPTRCVTCGWPWTWWCAPPPSSTSLPSAWTGLCVLVPAILWEVAFQSLSAWGDISNSVVTGDSCHQRRQACVGSFLELWMELTFIACQYDLVTPIPRKQDTPKHWWEDELEQCTLQSLSGSKQATHTGRQPHWRHQSLARQGASSGVCPARGQWRTARPGATTLGSRSAPRNCESSHLVLGHPHAHLQEQPSDTDWLYILKSDAEIEVKYCSFLRSRVNPTYVQHLYRTFDRS